MGKNLIEREKQYRHFLLVILFLIVSHVAMIFGMVDPGIIASDNKIHEHNA